MFESGMQLDVVNSSVMMICFDALIACGGGIIIL